MGKKNRIKQLLGRFNKETGCKIKGLPYSFDGITREMFLKVDLDHDLALAIANVPYFLDDVALKELCSRVLNIPPSHVQMTSSTAFQGDIKKGYRSGHLVFATVQARRRAFDAIGSLSEPFKLEELNIKLPAWHQPLSKRSTRKRRLPNKSGENVDETHDALDEENPGADITKPDDDGWITVTRKDKFSFRGKINRPRENGDTKLCMTDQYFDEKMMDVDVVPVPRKKRRR